jgi:hypothetical protein
VIEAPRTRGPLNHRSIQLSASPWAATSTQSPPDQSQRLLRPAPTRFNQNVNGSFCNICFQAPMSFLITWLVTGIKILFQPQPQTASSPSLPQQLVIENEIKSAPPPLVFSPTEDGWREISQSASKQVKRRKIAAPQINETAVASIFKELGWYVSGTDIRRVTKKWSAGEHFRTEYGFIVDRMVVLIKSCHQEMGFFH